MAADDAEAGSADQPAMDAAADSVLRWFVEGGAPAVSADVFVTDYLEKKPLHVHGRPATHFQQAPDAASALLPHGVAWSSALMRAAVERGTVHHGTDANVVRFEPKVERRVAMRTEGVIALPEYDQALRDGWSVRFLRPQEHEPELSALLFLFDERMGCHTGMNSYWTPKKSQGFAPHYDDVDVFMLQLEGSKRWRVYPPPTDADVLCRTSSPDYLPSQMPAPTLDVVLRAGETLYLPRGWVHQGITSTDEHSLHVTVSAFQTHTWAELLKTTLAYKVDQLATRRVDMRRALPLNWLDAVGSAFNAASMGPHRAKLSCAFPVGGTANAAAAASELRQQIQRTVREFTAAVAADVATKDGLIDKGADLFAIEVLARRQPPPKAAGIAAGRPARLRLVSRHAARVVVGADEVELHHCGANSTVCLGPTSAPSYARFELTFAPALVALVAAGGRWVTVADLPFPDVEADGEDAGTVADELQAMRDDLVDALLATGVVIGE